MKNATVKFSITTADFPGHEFPQTAGQVTYGPVELVGGRRDWAFVIVARTDAPDAPERARAYEAAGADVIFAEAQATLDDYRRVVDAVSIPVLANLTEFGLTPLFTLEELRGHLLSGFAETYSLSLQQTLFAMGTRAIAFAGREAAK